MNEYTINCPCCGNEIKIQFEGSGDATTFLLDINQISQEEISNKLGIELGVVDSD